MKRLEAKYRAAEDDSKAPPVTDPRWAGWSAPVLAMLSEPRGWPEMELWAKQQRMGGAALRQCLAWLEGEGLAQSISSTDTILWVKVGWKPKEEPECNNPLDAPSAEAPSSPSAPDAPSAEPSPNDTSTAPRRKRKRVSP